MVQRIIVVATAEEVGIAQNLFPGLPVMVAGVGINVIQSLSAVSRDIEIINIGYAGGYELKKGGIYSVGRCKMFHPNVEYKEPLFELVPIEGYNAATCYTGGDFVLNYKGQPVLFDMELALICAMGFRVQAIKVVSDNLNYDEYEETIKTN